MKSFTASTPLGLAKVHVGSDQLPFVIQSGTVLASGVPEVVRSDEEREGWLVCVPQTQWMRRDVTRWEGDEVEWVAAQGKNLLLIEGIAPVWGGRPNESSDRLRGVQFIDDQVLDVDWDLALVPVKRACCGRPGNEQPATLPLPALAFELS